MAFRKSFKGIQPSCPSQRAYERALVTHDELVDGVVVHKTYVDDIDLTDELNNIPRPEEYSIEALMSAGVPLQEVPTTIYTKNDPSTIESEVNDAVVESLNNVENI